jgi:hypothetical protein
VVPDVVEPVPVEVLPAEAPPELVAELPPEDGLPLPPCGVDGFPSPGAGEISLAQDDKQTASGTAASAPEHRAQEPRRAITSIIMIPRDSRFCVRALEFFDRGAAPEAGFLPAFVIVDSAPRCHGIAPVL